MGPASLRSAISSPVAPRGSGAIAFRLVPEVQVRKEQARHWGEYTPVIDQLPENAEDAERGLRAGVEKQDQASNWDWNEGWTAMRVRKNRKTTDHSGSSFDSFLEQEGIREEVEAVALKRVLARQLEQAMQKQHKTKQAMARQLHTSRSQLERLLDPRNVSVTLETITRAARALGKRVIIRVADVKAAKRA